MTPRVTKSPRFAMTGRGHAQIKPDADNGSRCPVCRRTTTLTASGHLRKHRDLFGHDCYNRRTA